MFCLISPQCTYSFVSIKYSKFFPVLSQIISHSQLEFLEEATNESYFQGSHIWLRSWFLYLSGCRHQTQVWSILGFLDFSLCTQVKNRLWLDLCRVCCLFVLYHNNNHVYIVPCCVSDDHLLQTLLFHQYGLKSQSIATTFLMYVLITDNGNCQIIWVSITPILMVAKLTDILFFQNKSI